MLPMYVGGDTGEATAVVITTKARLSVSIDRVSGVKQRYSVHFLTSFSIVDRSRVYSKVTVGIRPAG